MGEFFGSIYCWFEEFFGLDLANYLWGQASPLAQTNGFIGIGWAMLGISLVVCVLFYYVVNHPRLCNWWGWGLFLLINAVVNFIVGWQYVLKDYYADLMVTVDPSTNQKVPLNIGESELVCFGLSNMILSLLMFVLFSFIFKWKSTNCSHSPF